MGDCFVVRRGAAALPDAAARDLCGYEGLTGVRMYRGEG